MVALEAANEKLPSDPKQVVSRVPVAGTVNAALIGYYESAAFKALGKTTQQNTRAILERLIRTEHGDKRTLMMHAKAVQAIASKLTPNAQRNFRKAMQHFVRYYCVPLGLMTANPVAGLELIAGRSPGVSMRGRTMRSRHIASVMRRARRPGLH